MFRYIALAWQHPEAEHAAREFAASLRAHPRWRSAITRPGLEVFVADAKQGINGDYVLDQGRGIVVGRLFRRGGLGQAGNADITLTALECARIVQSGGQSLVDDFWGRYIAFVPTDSGATRVLRDPSGTLPCFFIRHRGVWLVFSWLEDVLALLPSLPPPRVNWDAVGGQLLFGELGGRETALEHVCRVVPGEWVELGDRPPRHELLWNAIDLAQSAVAAADGPLPARQLRHTVRACTRAWAGCYDSIVLRLSGGVDSSILVNCLTPEDTAASVLCVNHHSRGSDSDERRFARLAAARAGRELVERERDTDFDLESVLKAARTPTPGNYVGRMSARADAELAARWGAQALFTGAGGDQLFFEFPRCWPAADYLRCRGMDAGFLPAALDAARLGRVSLWRALRCAFAERLRPAPPWPDVRTLLPLTGPAAWEMDACRQRFVHPALADLGRLPIGKAAQTRALVHPVAYDDPFDPESAPETVNPLLSQPLVELCLQLPTWVLTQGGRGRALARQAFAAELPPEIARRRSKGGMEEHIKAVLHHHIDFARGLLLDGELVRRGLLDRARVEEVLSGRPTPLASHVGRIHVYIGIEAWLSCWPSGECPVAG